MNQIGSYIEVNKENIFSKGKNNCGNDSFFDPNRPPLRDITYLYDKSDDKEEQENKVTSILNIEFKKIIFRN